jgi:hypothetical protein
MCSVCQETPCPGCVERSAEIKRLTKERNELIVDLDFRTKQRDRANKEHDDLLREKMAKLLAPEGRMN